MGERDERFPAIFGGPSPEIRREKVGQQTAKKGDVPFLAHFLTFFLKGENCPGPLSAILLGGRKTWAAL